MNKYENLPESLKELKQWVCFKLEFNDKKGKADKIPKNALTGYNAKSNDPDTWTDFETAVAAVDKYGFDGIGIQFANGIFGVDLDNVIQNGELTAEAQDIIRTMNSYTEYSPSGKGIHILARGTIPGKDRRKGNVEMYSEGRFFTVTGNIVDTPKNLYERTAQAAAVHKKYLSREEKPLVMDYKEDLSITDSELLQRAGSAQNGTTFNALMSGSTSGYNSHSEADLALCNLLAYWTNGDAPRMDRLFRQSGLYRPEKWNKRHGADTYGNMTIGKALSDFRPYEKNPQSAQTPGADRGITQEGKPTTLYQNIESNPTEKNPQPDKVSDYLEKNFVKDIEKFKLYKDRMTGFKNLDALAGGLYPGLYVIGAISSLGKTTFVHQMADQLAAMGDHILFFSLEQNRLEMVTKSLSRITARNNKDNAVSAIDIRRGKITDEVVKAAEEYAKTAENMNVIECNFDININTIINYTKQYMAANKVKPIIIVDYVQIIPPTDPRQSDKEKTDHIVRGLKKLQSENDLVVFAISSINRSNYLTPIDFESFKESGGIEYTADVVWGLQLQILNEDIFNKDKNVKEKRDKVKAAKAEIPRKIELTCLKNRYGRSSYSCGFVYDPRYDLFKPDYTFTSEQDYQITLEKKRV